MNELALFAGAGGGILGGHLLGWRTVCAVERDAYAAQVLAQRQNDRCLRPFPIWSDICSFDGKPWRGIVDIVSGGFPCQDISSAGRGAGIEGSRSGLWSEMARIIGEIRPSFVFVENSPLLIGKGLALVISDLAKNGYDCQWSRVSAKEFGAPHKRDRLWLVGRNVRDTTSSGLPIGFNCQMERSEEVQKPERPGWWPTEPELARVANGMAHRVDRIKALGNGQVPRVAATAFSILK
ncbi:DNA cytosine methyltransferase [Erwinia billingiae]|uniref:DNA cytosine methyltransferase n=1 Tax=Erwinia billingiae TaxID=182337 RepID=UPI0019D211D6|nr:DNA cytosine methyltransferase [Erwinia billingiae]MBN7122844.1 DNA cytosine methyltransferase [Erwinia billingiae]